ncbi:MAG: DUF3499 family protein [Acidimicrobiales bacterium]
MGLRCARLSCNRSAAASLQFDSSGSRVLLVDLVEAVAGIPVCAAHASTRTAPMGWTLEDLRTGRQQHEHREPTHAEPIDNGPVRAPVRRPGDAGYPWGAAASRSLEPNTPLLARAFRSG